MKLEIGSNIIHSYKRLPYKAWYAIAEFVDNSTQSYFNNKIVLDERLAEQGEHFCVRVLYDKKHDKVLRITDNAMGMSVDDLTRALRLGHPPANPDGRSKYGLGLKYAAFWMGDEWEITTKRLGEEIEHRILVSVDKLLTEGNNVEYSTISVPDSLSHYTIIEIRKHNQSFAGRTLGKIRQHLQSMYREDIRSGVLRLDWQGEELSWDEPVLLTENGIHYRRNIEFGIQNKRVEGWVGILERGSRPRAGFAIMQYGRVVHDNWRPGAIFGQEGGSNDLVNQRLVGELSFSGFDVNHTKDDILWADDEESKVEEKLLELCQDLKQFAKEFRKSGTDERGPNLAAVATAVDEIKRELESPEMIDAIQFTEVPNREIIRSVNEHVLEAAQNQNGYERIIIRGLEVRLLVTAELSPNDPYVATEAGDEVVVVVVNAAHPHYTNLSDREFENYLRHCVYDGIAEWQARKKSARIEHNTVKLLKDQLLRVPFKLEQSEIPVIDDDSDVYYPDGT